MYSSNNSLNQIVQAVEQFNNCVVPFDGYQNFQCGFRYPVYINIDRTKKALNIAKMLMEKKYMGNMELEKFLKLVEEIESQL